MTARPVVRGELLYLLHDDGIQFSGYGLVVENGNPRHLIGLLMVDRPQPVSEVWLHEVEETFGQVDLYVMVKTGERGLACHLWIDEASLDHVRKIPSVYGEVLQGALGVLFDNPPSPHLDVAWDRSRKLWVSSFHTFDKAGGAETLNSLKMRIPRFLLGSVVATPGALVALEDAGQLPQEFLHRHVVGDWGDLDEHDRQANELALKYGDRILSAYRTKKGTKLWVITEYDRSVTTLLLPAEY